MLGPRYTLYSIILVFFSWNKPKLHSVIDMNGRVGLKKVSRRRAGAAASSAWKKLAAAGLGRLLTFFYSEFSSSERDTLATVSVTGEWLPGAPRLKYR